MGCLAIKGLNVSPESFARAKMKKGSSLGRFNSEGTKGITVYRLNL